MKRALIFALNIAFCLLFSFSAIAGEGLSSGKKALIDNIQADAALQSGMNINSSGAVNIELVNIQNISPSLADLLNGSALSLQYKLNSPANQMGININGVLGPKTISGNMYISESRIIFDKNLVQLLNLFNSSPGTAEALPQYLYIQDPGVAGIWKHIANKGYPMPPEVIDLFSFFIEAIPNEYIVEDGDQVVLKLDQKSFPDVMLAFSQKIESEPERFSTLLAKYINFAYPGGNSQDDVLAEMQANIKNGNFPSSTDEINQYLKENELEISEILYSVPKNSSGSATIKMTIKTKGGTISFTVHETKKKDRIDGDLKFSIRINDSTSFMMDGKGTFSQTKTSYKSSYNVHFVVAQPRMPFSATLDVISRAQAEDNVNVNVPELTLQNSKEMSSLTPGYLGENWYTVNGEEKWSDVPPAIKNGRTMVPIRFIAEEFGCQVNLVGNTVNLTTN